MNKIIGAVASVTLSAVGIFYANFAKDLNDASTAKIINVRVCKVVEHEAINSVVAGMSNYLKTREKIKKGRIKYKISVETCQGNMAIASQIVAKFAASSTDVVVTVGTIPSQAAFKFAVKNQIKLVFSSVTNPADIAENFANSNTTGVSNFVALKPQLELFRKIQSSLKKLGIIYNMGEANSTYIVNALKPICAAMNLELVEQSMTKISELPQMVEKLAQQVDAIFISNDNMALSGISNIVAICKKYGVPVYVSDTDQVEKGCAAALGPNQYQIGVQTGKIVEKIADGTDINIMKVEYPDTKELYLNENSCVEISADLVAQAKKFFTKSQKN